MHGNIIFMHELFMPFFTCMLLSVREGSTQRKYFDYRTEELIYHKGGGVSGFIIPVQILY